jgi:hypothetical protein
MTLNLKPHEIDILLGECSNEISMIKSELTGMLIRRDSLKRKIKEWDNEKEWLQMLKDGLSFDDFLTTIPGNTLTTLKKHHQKIMKRYNEMDINLK